MNGNKSFFSNTLQLMYGNIGAQAINFLTIPIITRIYSPDNYGLLFIFLSISMVIVSMSNLRLNVAILLAEEENDAILVIVVCLVILTGISLFVLGAGSLIFFFDFEILAAYRNLRIYIFFLAGYVFLQGAFLIFNPWHIRKNQFKILGIAIICQVFADKGFSISIGYVLGDNPLWLLGGALFGCFMSTILLFLEGILTELKIALKSISYTSLVSTLNRYKNFLIYSPINLLEVLSREITPILFGFFFGATIVGFYGLGSRIMRRPLNIFSDAITRSFFHELATKKRLNIAYIDKVHDLFYYLFLLGIVPVIIFSLVAPEFIGVIFGKKWEASGIYVGILAFPFFSNFLYKPLSIVFEIQERQGLRFIITIISFIITPLSIYLGAKTENPVQAISIYAATVFVMDFTFIFLLLKLAGVDLYRIAKRTLTSSAIIICSILPVVWAKLQWAPESPVLFIISAIITIFIFFLAIARLDKRIFYFLIQSFNRRLNRQNLS